jgi:aspartate kinase
MTRAIVVSKFGGTSMKDAQAMRRSAQICKKQGSTITVVSATSGTTNQLLELADVALEGRDKEAKKIWQALSDKHHQIAEELKCTAEQRAELDQLLKEAKTISKGVNLMRDLSLKARDRLVGLGERISSLLFTQALAEAYDFQKDVRLFDVREIMKTDDQFTRAEPLLAEIKIAAQTHLLPLIEQGAVLVTQGFIGMTLDGVSTTLGRGGSDYSAALVAEAVDASICEIWTDVAGIATTDPRICPKARLIDEITFMEASELAIFGAKILHPTTLQPALRADIPVFVGSSYEPDLPGTWIRHQTKHTPLVRAMATRPRQGLVTLTTPQMLQHHGFLFKIFEVFARHKVSVDSVTTSEISVSITIDEHALQNKQLFKDLEQYAQIEIEDHLTMVSLIGNKINHTPGLAKKIFHAIDDINVRMICLGASRHNFCFLVSDSEGAEALRRLHACFIEQGE